MRTREPDKPTSREPDKPKSRESDKPTSRESDKPTSRESDWWQNAVIYQIYLRSFLDSNNDGIGDLPGIIQKLDYIADLGIDAIWISPFYPSPMKDFGYDVSDYKNIDPLFGTLDDFDELLKQAHKRDLKIIIDLVLSHTSEQHPWFKDSAKKGWYVWANAKPDGAPPNNWQSVFGGSAWEWSDEYQQYYLHNFLKEQPDLNFHNKDVQAEILEICKFWFDRKVDGFRLDVVNFYFHDEQLRDNPPSDKKNFATQFEHDTPYSAQKHIYDKSRPENLDFIEKLRALADSYPNRFLMGEIGDDHPYDLANKYTNPERLHTCYNPFLMSGTEKKLTPTLIREPIEHVFKLNKNARPTWAFSNHDVVRAASRWYKLYSHNPDFSKMLIALLGCLPGTLCLYQGEELGLPEAEIPYDKLQDPWAKETWPKWQGRDGCRTPIPWSQNTPNNQWLPIPESHTLLNVQAQKRDKNSTLNFTQKFLHWRKKNIDLFKGKFQLINTSNENIIHILYSTKKTETNCIFNISEHKTAHKTHNLSPFGFHVDGFLIG